MRARSIGGWVGLSRLRQRGEGALLGLAPLDDDTQKKPIVLIGAIVLIGVRRGG